MNNIYKKMVLLVLLSLCSTFSVLSYAAVAPQFSEGTNEYWYAVRFTRGSVFLTANGINQTMTVAANQYTNSQQWKLVGNENEFFLVNRDGHFAAVKNGTWNDKQNNCPLQEVKSQPAQGFKLLNKGDAYVVESLLKPGKYLNTWAGYDAGTPIGVYNDVDDPNSKIVFEKANSGPFSLSGATNYTPAEKLSLWYTVPAKDAGAGNPWMEYSLPIGNGQLGASIFAGVRNDEILFNEKTLWTGTSKSVGTTGNGWFDKGNGNEYGSYQVFGSINIEDQNGLGRVTNYVRDLNLTNATASMSYTHAGVDYKREYIVSYPDKVVATHLTASQPGNININVTLSPKMSKGASKVSYTQEGKMGLAHFNGKLDVVNFDAHMKVVAKGGSVKASQNGVLVSNADEVTILLAAGTDFDNTKDSFVSGAGQGGLATDMKGRVDAAANQTWDKLYKTHVDDYKYFFDRVHLDLTGSANTMNTKALVDNYSGGSSTNDLMLEELYFNYGRYLEIASSRGVALPSNLQGIWANNNKSAWNADIHANINVQMNYWPAEPTNMPEMHMPFLDYIINMYNSEPWKRFASESGQNRGWTCYTENNIFGGVGAWAHNYVITNAWYCTHLWQHYRYTLDEKFLAKAFPAMLSATQFWLDRLKNVNGEYLCPNETSPEHGPKAEDGVAHAQQLVWDLFDNTLKAVKVLGEDVIPANDLADLKEKFSKLDKGLATEKGPDGQQLLREWKKSNYTAGQNGHRHLSHLMCLYPFSQVNSNSEFFQPAINSLLHRGDASTGWSMGWKINLWARALNGNHAHDILKMALKHSTSYGTNEKAGGIYYNLFDSHSPFQIDGNFGACAGIAEMLFQCHSEVLEFLPALPDTWNNGSITGLKGIGNFTVGVEWKNGQATMLTIDNVKGQKCLVKCAHANKAIDQVSVTVSGKNVKPVAKGNGVFEIHSVSGDQIVIDFTKEPGVDPEPKPEPVYSGQCGENLKWNLAKKTGVMNITGTGAMYDYTAEKPAPWTEVAAEVKSIIFPADMTHIGDRAFAACTQSMEVRFLNNEVTIGVDAFSSSIKTILEVKDVDYAAKAFPLTENKYSEIVYNRELADKKWGTVILPFALNFETAASYDFYELSAVSGKTVTFKYVRNPQANQPYMYRNASGAHALQMISDKTTTIDASAAFSKVVGEWTILGSFAPMTIGGAKLATTYVLSGGKIMNSTNSVQIRPFRAYFNGPAFDAGNPSRAFRIVIEDENGETTDITEVLMDEASENGDIYDLTGRRVMKTVPGHIYIQNGNKFIAK